MNIAFGRGSTIFSVAEKIKAALASSSKITVAENRTGEIIKYVADVSLAKKILGFKPKTSLDEGIELSVGWYKSRGLI